MKFGGTSVGSAQAIRNAGSIVQNRLDQNPVVVVSAVSGVTNKLIEIGKSASESDNFSKSSSISELRTRHNEIMDELGIKKSIINDELNELEGVLARIQDDGLSKANLDHLQSFGERMSSKIFAEYLRTLGINSRQLISYNIGFVSDDNFTNAELKVCTYDNLQNCAMLRTPGVVNVVTGFIAKTINGEITTIGRGGSDTTAAVIGAAIGAKEVQIWTDVNGILTTDPRIVDSARTIREISFSEAAELAYFGAKVIHPKTITPLVERRIPVRVLNTHNPEHEGTTIFKDSKPDGTYKAISMKKGKSLLRVESSRMLGAYGFLARIFSIFENHRTSVDLISSSEVSISITLDSEEHINEISDELREIGTVEIMHNRAIICIVGKGMRHTPGVAAEIMSIFSNEGINIEMISQGASEINVGVVVKDVDAEHAVRALHRELIENKEGVNDRNKS